MNDCEGLSPPKTKRKKEWFGFAHLYLLNWDKKSKPYNEIDVQIYTKLVELDSKLGRTASKQLRGCLECTTQSDIIMVSFFF